MSVNIRDRLPPRLRQFLSLLAEAYRSTLGKLFVCHKYIGRYGPFVLSGQFTFSNFRQWGNDHNGFFNQCVIEATRCKCFIDIGAHIGLVTIPVAAMSDSRCKVVAIEPNDANRKALLRHLRLNKLHNSVNVLSIVIGRRSGLVPFTDDTKITGMSSIDHTNLSSVPKQMKTLDQICSEYKLNPEVIKIDVEGAELQVLQGGYNTLRLCKPKLALSIHPRQISSYGDSIIDIVNLLHEIGYVIKDQGGESCIDLKFGEYWAEYSNIALYSSHDFQQ
jgi:FkbM family methyltransferase